MAMLTAAEMISLRAKIKTEFTRRSCSTGSLAGHANDAFATVPAKGNPVLAQQGQVTSDLLLMVKDYPNLVNAVSGQRIPIGFNNSLLTAVDNLAKETATQKSTSCRSACTGLCYAGCSTACYGCAGNSKTTVSYSAGESGVHYAKIPGRETTDTEIDTEVKSAVSTNNAGCAGCGASCMSGCSSGCMYGCEGTCKNNCGGGCSAESARANRNDTSKIALYCGCGVEGPGDCSGDCSGDCTEDCGHMCAGYCVGSCQANCADDCDGCSGGCEGKCYGGCNTGCQGVCTGACSGNCNNNCRGSCSTQCYGNATGKTLTYY